MEEIFSIALAVHLRTSLCLISFLACFRIPILCLITPSCALNMTGIRPKNPALSEMRDNPVGSSHKTVKLRGLSSNLWATSAFSCFNYSLPNLTIVPRKKFSVNLFIKKLIFLRFEIILLFFWKKNLK